MQYIDSDSNTSNGRTFIVDANEIRVTGDGTVSGTGVSGVNQATGVIRTVLTLTNVSIPMTDATTAGSHGSLKVFTFPQGVIGYLGGSCDLTISRVGTNLTATSAVVGSVGTATVGVDNATLTSTEADLIPSTASTLSSGAGTTKGKYATAPQVPFDGSSTAKEAYLNFATPDAGSTGNDVLLVNGTITLVWANYGDV